MLLKILSNKLKYPVKKYIDNLYLHQRLLLVLLATVLMFILGFPYPIFLAIAKISFVGLLIALVVDMVNLFRVSNPLNGKRIIEEKLSNGDYNPVIIQLHGRYPFRTSIKVIDEFPVQLQLRDKEFLLKNLRPHFDEEIFYELRPTERGEYQFGNIQVFISSQISLLKRKVTIEAEQRAKVYPSFIQYRKFAFLAISNRLQEIGVKKVRQLGSNKEFEQIREYVRGDDYRIINWKATARNNHLMVNQYQEERSQHIYCIIDKGRLMHMPFEELSLMDYAINSALVMSGIALGRGDKPGLITFSDKIGSFLMASSKPGQMGLISEHLYDQDVRQKESDFLRLYKNIRIKLKKRSLLLMYTNFDSLVTLHRQVKYLKALSRSHLLCIIIFDNTEINNRAEKQSYTIREAYLQTIAEKFQYDKRQIIKELNNQGIQTILTEPQNLTIQSINKYIELKARGAI